MRQHKREPAAAVLVATLAGLICCQCQQAVGAEDVFTLAAEPREAAVSGPDLYQGFTASSPRRLPELASKSVVPPARVVRSKGRPSNPFRRQPDRQPEPPAETVGRVNTSVTEPPAPTVEQLPEASLAEALQPVAIAETTVGECDFLMEPYDASASPAEGGTFLPLPQPVGPTETADELNELASLWRAFDSTSGDGADLPVQPASGAFPDSGGEVVELFTQAAQFEVVPSGETPLPMADSTTPSTRPEAAAAPALAATGFGSGRRSPTLTSIKQTTVDITPVAQEIDGESTSTDRPRDMAVEKYGPYRDAAVSANEFVRFALNSCLWYSPAMRHKPLYFEQPKLERYGSHLGGQCEASLEAAAHFVGATLSLPYQVAAQPPSTCVYTLGVYRPGNCNPHFFHVSRPNAKGLAAQGAAVAGLVLLFP